MNTRTIIEIEKGRSNPKLETVGLLADELDLNMNAIISPEKVFPGTVQKCVYDFFNGKSEAEAQRYIDLCRQMERFSEKSE